MSHYGVVRITRDKQCFDRRTLKCDAIGEFPSAHFRHHHVGQEEVDHAIKLVGTFQRFFAGTRFEDRVA